MRAPRSPASWLSIVVPLIIVGFLAAHLLSVSVVRDLHGHAEQIESIGRRNRLLSAMRGNLHRMAMVVGPAEPGESFDRATFADARAALERQLESLRDLPTSPGEERLAADVEDALEDAESAVERWVTLLEGGAPTGAEEESALTIVRRADGAIEQLIDVNIARTEAESERIAQTDERIRRLTPTFDAVAAGFALVLMGLAVQAARQHARLADDRNRLAEQRAEELELFAARVAHDLKNPLNALSLRLQYGAERFKAHGDVRAELVKSAEAASRMDRIIEGLLVFARAGGRPERDARAVVSEVLADVVVDFTADAAEADTELVVEPAPPIAVACPAGPLSSILGNLLRNAIKFVVDASTPERRVCVRATERHGRVRIEVEDTGPGVPQGMESAIFEPFVRAGASARRPGLGLGLATVKRLVEAYDGHVSVQPRAGGGSRFLVDLPSAPPAAAPPAAAPAE